MTDARRPLVSVVMPTHGRPTHLRTALRAVVAQDYDGPIEVLVVFDRTEPDRTLERDEPDRSVRTLRNSRSDGLAGNRNTGIVDAAGEYVAFCDDDDVWSPSKLTRQVDALQAHPDAVMATCGITVSYRGRLIGRPADVVSVARADLIRSRLSNLHPSTFLFRRNRLIDDIGLVDEAIPGGYGEDYDILLRATRLSDVVHVPDPLTVVRWGTQSHFRDRFDLTASGLTWLLDRYPEFLDDRKGYARIAAQIAFARSALGDRSEGLRWARIAVRNDPLQPRILLALAVASGVIDSEFVLDQLNRRGRGI